MRAYNMCLYVRHFRACGVGGKIRPKDYMTTTYVVGNNNNNNKTI